MRAFVNNIKRLHLHLLSITTIRVSIALVQWYSLQLISPTSLMPIISLSLSHTHTQRQSCCAAYLFVYANIAVRMCSFPFHPTQQQPSANIQVHYYQYSKKRHSFIFQPFVTTEFYTNFNTKLRTNSEKAEKRGNPLASTTGLLFGRRRTESPNSGRNGYIQRNC